MRIIERKGLRSLQHSFRKGGSVLTRERYLGKSVPKDIERMKEEFMRACRKEAFYETFEKIRTGFQKEWRGYPPTIKKKVLQQLSIDFTYNTNAIEGSTITLNETQEIIDHHIAPNKPLSDIRETERHAELFRKSCKSDRPSLREHCSNGIRSSFKRRNPISPERCASISCVLATMSRPTGKISRDCFKNSSCSGKKATRCIRSSTLRDCITASRRYTRSATETAGSGAFS